MEEKFGSRSSFIMASVGSAVGLGNIFRFPALALKYGLIFIIIYILFLLTVGIPLLTSELALGRKYGGSAVNIIRSSNPRFTPLGTVCSINSFIILTYYTVLYSYVVLAAFFSWNLKSKTPDDAQRLLPEIIYRGDFPLFTLVFLIFAAASVMLCFGSAERLGKISTASVTFATVIIGVMAVFGGVSGAENLRSFISLSLHPLLNIGFWTDTLGQVFFSLSIMVGVMLTYGAFLKKGESIALCGFIIAFFDLAVSLTATLIYAAVGSSQQGLFACFSVYPKAFASLGGAVGSAVSLLFYLSVAVLCLDSVFAYLKSVCSAMSEKFRVKENGCAAVVVLVSTSLGFLLLGEKGKGLIELVDGKAVPLITLATGFFEVLLISKEKELIREINSGGWVKISPAFFSFSIKIFIPIAILLLFVLQIFF